MSNGDNLLYLDSGCELSFIQKDYLLECIDKVKIDKIIGATTPIYDEKN